MDVIMESNIVFSGGHADLDDRFADAHCDGVLDVFDFLDVLDAAFSGGTIQTCFIY
jgi:hypothetical protein